MSPEEARIFRNLSAGEIILIVVALLLLFGARRLPDLARSIGRSARELRKGMEEGMEDDPEVSDADSTETHEGP